MHIMCLASHDQYPITAALLCKQHFLDRLHNAKSRLAAYGQCRKVKCLGHHDLSAESHELLLDSMNVCNAFELFQILLSKCPESG